MEYRTELLAKLANGRKQGVIKEVWDFISFMISLPKGLNLYNEVVEQIPAESEFIYKKRNDRNKVNAKKNFFLPRSLVDNIFEGDIFSYKYWVLCRD